MKNRNEKADIVFDIIGKLKKFDTDIGPQDMYQSHISFVPECTEIFNSYIKNNETLTGKMYFKEIGKNIEYYLPVENNAKPVFVIRANKTV